MGHTIRIGGKDYHDRGDIDLDAVDVRLADGTRLSEARAQELAEEIHERAQGGRPSPSHASTLRSSALLSRPS